MSIVNAAPKIQNLLGPEAISDIGSPHQAHLWSDGSSCWLSTLLPLVVPDSWLLEFTYAASGGNDFSWEQLLHCGDVLLEQLQHLSTTTDLLKKPLFLISHGLGGVIVKRAVGVLYKQFYNRQFERISRTLCGIVFLGVPHPVIDRPEDWSKLALMLKASTKLTKKAVDKTGGQLSTVARVSRLFDESLLSVPVLNVSESRPTKIGTGFLSPKRVVLVDEAFAKTSARRETAITIDVQHQDICNIDASSKLWSELKSFLSSALTSMMPLSAGTNPLAPRSFAGWTQTASESGENELLSTNRATAHSSEHSFLENLTLKDTPPTLSKALNLPLHYIKPQVRNPDFYGRQDVLQSIGNVLTPKTGQASVARSSHLKTFAICGAGGLGKTQVAVEYAFANQGKFDAIFILQASDSVKLAQQCAEITLALGLETETSGDQIVSRDIFLGWLSQPCRKVLETGLPVEDADAPDPTWLLIFDNADDLSVIRDFWPLTGNGSILVTSRDPLAKTRAHVSVMNGTDLEPFPRDEAGELLRDLTGNKKETDIELSQLIADKLSGFPLAIAQIAGTITRRDLSLTEFLELYEKRSMQLDFHKAHEGNALKSLFTVFAFEGLSPQALSLLSIISFLDPDEISEEVLINMSKLEPSERLIDYPIDMAAFLSARTELLKSSLVRRNRDQRVLQIHRIIQDVTRSRMESAILESTFAAATNLMYFSWPFSEFEFSVARWRQCEPVLTHVASLLRAYNSDDILKTYVQLCGKMARLAMDFGWYHVERGNNPESLPYFKLCEEICQLAPDDTQVTRGDKEGCLAQIASVANDYETAIQHAEVSVAIMDLHAKGNFRLPQAHNELCEAYIAAGRYEEAIEQADLAMTGYYALPYFCYPDWPMMNKGLALTYLGRLNEASEVLESYLEHRERAFGPMDARNYKTGQGLLFLGRVRGFQGRVSESLDLYLKALAQYHSTIGGNHYRVAALYVKLGITYNSLGEHVEARTMYTKALEIYDKREEFAAQIARTYQKLFEVNSMSGAIDEAAGNMQMEQVFLDILSKKHGRRIESHQIRAFIPNWSD